MTLDEMISDLYYVVHKSQMATLELGDESARQLLRWLEDYKELKETTRWIPCSEMLPENGQRVLIRSSSNRFFDVIYHSDIQYPNFTIKIFGHTYAWDYRDVISWKPLPEPPKGE